MRALSIVAAATLCGLSGIAAAAPDWEKVEHVFERPATVSGEVRRFSFPRSDLEVTLDGVAVKPGLALGSWVAFKEAGDGATLMGDLVLTEGEVRRVMAALSRGGISVTALHNHLLRAEPATMYLHIGGRGDPVAMARAIRVALEQSRTPIATEPPKDQASPIALDTAALDRAIGHGGKADGGIYKFAVPRADGVSAHGHDVPEAMGSAVAIAFQPTGDGKAAVTGDFVLEAEEVDPVVGALMEHGIEVTALHNHMLDEEPRLFFMHFWAHDDAETLAKGLRAALDEVETAVAER